MNRKVLYFKSTKILIDAYQHELLIHDNWGGCVNAHLIAGNMGYTMVPLLFGGVFIRMQWEKDGNNVGSCRYWGRILEAKNAFERREVRRKIGKENYKWTLKCLAATGYTYKELKEIMEIFDACYDEKDQGNYVLPGLKAVLARLKQIHSVSEEDKATTFKKEFDREKQLIESLTDVKYPWLKMVEQGEDLNWSSYLLQKQNLDTVKVITTVRGKMVTRNEGVTEAALV